MSVVIPGDVVGDASKFDCGDGVYERNGHLYACTVGARVIERAPSDSVSKCALLLGLKLISGVSEGFKGLDGIASKAVISVRAPGDAALVSPVVGSQVTCRVRRLIFLLLSMSIVVIIVYMQCIYRCSGSIRALPLWPFCVLKRRL
jgi:hypothetical protein